MNTVSLFRETFRKPKMPYNDLHSIRCYTRLIQHIVRNGVLKKICNHLYSPVIEKKTQFFRESFVGEYYNITPTRAKCSVYKYL